MYLRCNSYVIFVLHVVPFDEDDRDPNVWFLDHNYLENMVAMFKKVNCTYASESQQEKIIERELLHYNNNYVTFIACVCVNHNICSLVMWHKDYIPEQ